MIKVGNATLKDAWEPAALALASGLMTARGEQSLQDDEIRDVSAVSVAQSLKRIADALSGLDWNTVNGWAQTIAWNAGRSFESGRRQ